MYFSLILPFLSCQCRFKNSYNNFVEIWKHNITGGFYMDEQFIRDRITSLRVQKNISEYKMSLDLGHSKSYIQSIASGRALPSMTEFLYICDYLGVTPKDFFDPQIKNPALVTQAVDGMKGLSNSDLTLLISIIERLSKE